MACSSRPGPQALINLIEHASGHRFTQTEWHAITTLAAADGYDCSRRRAGHGDAESAIHQLGDTLTEEWRNSDFNDEDFRDTVNDYATDIMNTDPRQSLLAVAGYLTEQGVHATLERIHPQLAGRPRVRKFTTVTHLGTLNTSDRKNWSLEGDGLSVSVHPEAWKQIARLGGSEQWTLARTDGTPLTFLDAHALTDKQRADIANWGIREGIVTETTAYTVTTYDDELDEDMTAMYATRADAETDTDDPDDINEIITFTFTGNSPRGADLGNTVDILTTVWTEQNTDHDGVWWHDKLDPAAYSAPRGVILPSRIHQLHITPTKNF